jgi:hypothetical protein
VLHESEQSLFIILLTDGDMRVEISTKDEVIAMIGQLVDEQPQYLNLYSVLHFLGGEMKTSDDDRIFIAPIKFLKILVGEFKSYQGKSFRPKE